MAATASNVALGKPANQTDTAGGADPFLAVDGDSSTCSESASAAAEWTLDLKDYYLIEEVSIHPESSQWLTSVGAHSSHIGYAWNLPENIIGVKDDKVWYGIWIEVAFAKKVRLSRVDIYEYVRTYNDASGVGEIKCYVDDGWETVWSTTSTRPEYGHLIFSPNLTKSCYSNRLKLTVAPGYPRTYIDAVGIHTIKSYTIGMGLTYLKNEAESIMHISTNSTATWSPDNKGPFRYVRIQANPQNETLKLCEVQVKGNLQPRTPYFRVATGIAMSNPPVSTVIKVVSNSVCAFICLRQMDPPCVTAQFDQATQSCALFNGFEHTREPSNTKTTILFHFASHFFAN